MPKCLKTVSLGIDNSSRANKFRQFINHYYHYYHINNHVQAKY